MTVLQSEVYVKRNIHTHITPNVEDSVATCIGKCVMANILNMNQTMYTRTWFGNTCVPNHVRVYMVWFKFKLLVFVCLY
jgi:hypothetical protein